MAPNTRVQIVSEENSIPDDATRANLNSSYRFEGLYLGDYTDYGFSDDKILVY